MPTWLKIVLIVVGIFLLLGIGAIVAGVVWYQKYGKGIVEGAMHAVEDGQKYGRTSDNAACVDESIVRYKRDSTGMENLISAKGFLTGCLQTSRETPNFCNNVPGPFDFQEGLRWKTDQCRQHGLGGDKNCPQMFDAVQQHCQNKK
jgi:hypothetical protein